MVLAMLLGGLRRSEMLGIRMQDLSAGERRQRVGCAAANDASTSRMATPWMQIGGRPPSTA
jgi:hypothetical protein